MDHSALAYSSIPQLLMCCTLRWFLRFSSDALNGHIWLPLIRTSKLHPQYVARRQCEKWDSVKEKDWSSRGPNSSTMNAWACRHNIFLSATSWRFFILSNVSTVQTMPSRSPYGGNVRKLVLAFDVGTTYSGISYRFFGFVPICIWTNVDLASWNLE